ncbi:MAG: AMP-binding protein [Gammaproteobacteria bacterium]|nr:AMP-binding protein [Gammaproteobacteria bacterium]
MNKNIYTVFEQHFPSSSDSVFIETVSGESYTYAVLQQHVARIANLLLAHGLTKGDRVAVQVEKSPQVLFLYLACLRAGLIYLPLNTAYTESELAYFLENARPATVVCDPCSEEMFARLGEAHGLRNIFCLDAQGAGTLMSLAARQSDMFTTVECGKDDVAVILYTSGTTGRPKGAMITHGNLAANGMALQKTWHWRQDDILLHALPIFHIHGLFVACHNVLLGGSKMLFVPKFDAKRIIELLPKATVLMGVPTFYTRLLDSPDFNRDVCRNIRLFISGSAPLLEQTFIEFQERTGHTILERYGMTETGMNTSNPVDGARVAGTVGLPLPGVEVRIVDDSGQTVQADTVGLLQVRGENVFKGYWQMPEKTAEDFTQDGFFITGDLAKFDNSGYIAIVGRNKDMVITGGYNVYPKEIELLLDEIEGIRESAIIGLPHKDFGEAVTAVIIPDDIEHVPDEKTIISQLKAKLANYKVPKKIIVLEQLPRNTMGKVQKNVLREKYADLWR